MVSNIIGEFSSSTDSFPLFPFLTGTALGAGGGGGTALLLSSLTMRDLCPLFTTESMPTFFDAGGLGCGGDGLLPPEGDEEFSTKITSFILPTSDKKYRNPNSNALTSIPAGELRPASNNS